MSLLEVKADFSQLQRLANMLGAAGKNAPVAIARAINHTGDKARTAMKRTLTTQTGLKAGVIDRALKRTRAAQQGALTYVIASKGGDVRLKYFAARETRAGVSADPFGHRQVFPGTFIKGGRFPNRKPLKFGGQVMERSGGGRGPIHTVHSGLFIPEEMVTGATAEAFYEAAERDLPDRLVHELLRVIG